jgi:hypothetical protein
MGGVANEYITKLGCESFLRRVIAPLEMLRHASTFSVFEDL